MRLAIVSPFPPEISGVGQYGARLATGLAASGAFDSVIVLANRSANGQSQAAEPVEGRIAIRRVWARDWPASTAGILSALNELTPDVVWFNLGLSAFGRSRWANLLGLATPMLARAWGWPTVVTLHEIFEAANLRDLGAANGRITHLAGQAVTRMVLRADTVCFTLRRYVAEIGRRYGATNLAHVPVGAFDPPELLPRPATSPEILVFATYAPYKGLPILLDAFAELLAGQPDAWLTVAGGEHPRFPGYLDGIRAERREQPNVRWLGPVGESELRGLFGRASLVVLPYTATTGASSVIHRAAAYGRPVIVSDLPDVRALAAEEGLWLELAPSGDRAALAQAMRDLLADPARCDRMARHNLRAMRAMTLTDTCAAYISLFRAAKGICDTGSPYWPYSPAPGPPRAPPLAQGPRAVGWPKAVGRANPGPTGSELRETGSFGQGLWGGRGVGPGNAGAVDHGPERIEDSTDRIEDRGSRTQRQFR